MYLAFYIMCWSLQFRIICGTSHHKTRGEMCAQDCSKLGFYLWPPDFPSQALTWKSSKAPRISRHWTSSLPRRLILESLKFCQLFGDDWEPGWQPAEEEITLRLFQDERIVTTVPPPVIRSKKHKFNTFMKLSLLTISVSGPSLMFRKSNLVPVSFGHVAWKPPCLWTQHLGP